MSLIESVFMGVSGMFTVFAVLIALALVIVIISAVIRSRKAEIQEEVFYQVEVKPVATVQNKGVELINVSEKDAAIIMAIISDETKIGLNELNFKSIKRKDTEFVDVEDKDAAIIMAIISEQTQINLNELYFKSIKLIQK